MFRAITAALLIAQTLIIPMTGARTRDIQPASLFHTLFHDFFPEDDGTTYVQTGDIPAMWLRDSSAQTIPYVRFQSAYPLLRARFAGVIERNARAIDKDVYANAFQEDYHAWERKWEVDSIAWPVVLTLAYVDATHDRSVFTPNLHVALRQIVYTYNCEEHHRECSRYVYPYRVPTHEEFDEGTGLIWGAFRPSDDAVEYRFNIPQNVLAAVALRDIVKLARVGYGDTELSSRAQA
ncbi:MAG: glycoside hydrolase family 125 protein, partial [Candidatus Aquilonibacter sp.]